MTQRELHNKMKEEVVGGGHLELKQVQEESNLPYY